MSKLEAAQRLINVVCGDKDGDGMVVTNVGIGYAEPGYHDNETVWVLGDWNNKEKFINTGPGTVGHWETTDNTPSRLFDALERIKIQGEWYDEWEQCPHCNRIFRVSGDSYMWKPFYVQFGNGDRLCGECVLDDEFFDDALAEFVNISQRVVTWCDEKTLTDHGWERYNPRPYENGWYPGQNDTPAQAVERVQLDFPDNDWVFLLDENSQFYSKFSIFIKPKPTDDEEDDEEDDENIFNGH